MKIRDMYNYLIALHGYQTGIRIKLIGASPELLQDLNDQELLGEKREHEFFDYMLIAE